MLVLHANRLLSALPRSDRQHFISGCDEVNLVFAEVLYEPGEPIRHVYFPITGYISLINTTEKGSSLEVALIGDEGMHGITLLLGVNFSPLRAVVQGMGIGLRMKASLFQREIRLSPALLKGLQRYIYVRMCQLEQSAICNRFHLLESRLARWLLLSQDRAYSNELRITHEILALILGVRRVGITNAAGALQLRNLIKYSRGTITILDRLGLEAASCSCYKANNSTYDRHCFAT